MDNRALLIGRLAQHVEELKGFTEGLSDEELRKRPSLNKWSLYELAIHLVEVQDIFIERLTRMLVEEKPEIAPFIPDKAREDGLYLLENLQQRMAVFERQRATLVALLRTLTGEQWKLEGVHPHVRHYTVEKSMEALTRHEEHHFYQMFNIFFGVNGDS
jgi:uncharacterized damage-inducible protein DinB